jgi:hypothetical protein
LTKEVDRPVIRSAGDEFFNVGGDMWRVAGHLDEEPYFLQDSDWGYQGESADLNNPYQRLRGGMRDFLLDGAKAFTELREALYAAAARSEDAEEVGAAELDRIGRRLDR